MGNFITWIIAIPIVAGAIYIIVKNVKQSASGTGCDGCSGCGSRDSKDCGH